MNSADVRRKFLLAAVSVVIAIVLVNWLIKAAFLLVFYAIVATATVLGAMFLYGKLKRALNGSDRRDTR